MQHLNANIFHWMQNIVAIKQHRYTSRMSKKTAPVRRKIIWRVRVLMAERNIRSVSELVRRLDEIGVSISNAQLGRMIDNKSAHWSQEVIEGLVTVLECHVSDLWRDS